MNTNELGRIFERANQSFAQAQQVSAKVDRSVTRADNVMRRADERGGAVRAAAQRERQRLNSDLADRAKRVGIAIGLISLATIVIGLIVPIGMFGFLAAVGLAIGIAAVLAIKPASSLGTAGPSADLPNGEMVQRFDSYLYRARAALPPPAQAEVDAIGAILPSLRQTLERVDNFRPQCAGCTPIDVDPPACACSTATSRCPPPTAASRMAKARPPTSGWSKRCPRHAPRSVTYPNSSRARTSRHWRRRAGS